MKRFGHIGFGMLLFGPKTPNNGIKVIQMQIFQDFHGIRKLILTLWIQIIQLLLPWIVVNHVTPLCLFFLASPFQFSHLSFQNLCSLSCVSLSLSLSQMLVVILIVLTSEETPLWSIGLLMIIKCCFVQ